MVCPNCKSNIPDDSRFCPDCGKPVTAKDVNNLRAKVNEIKIRYIQGYNYFADRYRFSYIISNMSAEECERIIAMKNDIAQKNRELEQQERCQYTEEHATRNNIKNSYIMGIDLGTTNSRVSLFVDGKAVVIPNKEGNASTPSVVSFTQDNKIFVGEPAKRQTAMNAGRTLSSTKRILGLQYDELSMLESPLLFPIAEGDYNLPSIRIGERAYTPQEITTLILLKLKQSVKQYLGFEVNDAVITVPAWFSNSQRRAVLDSAQIAGINVRRLLNETTAAALSYGIDKSNEDMKIAIIDIGGGSAEVSIHEFGGGVFEVLSYNCLADIGGDDFDYAIVNWLVSTFKKMEGLDLANDFVAMQRLKEAAEKAKIELSESNSTEIILPYIVTTLSGPKHIRVTLTRDKFNKLTHSLIKPLPKACEIALRDAGCSKREIDEVILVGGSCTIPAVQKSIKEFFEKTPSRYVYINEAVVKGAAFQGAILNQDIGQDIVILDIIPFSMGIETLGGVMTKLIEANTTIPCKRSTVFSTAEDNQPEVTINVLQGEREKAEENRSIGRFNFSGYDAAPRGVPQIEVTFDIDVNELLHVSAKDLGTGKEQRVRMDAAPTLPREEIERIRRKYRVI